MSTRYYDSFVCIRYLVLSDKPRGDFLDQLGEAKYFLIFSNNEDNDKAIWIPSVGLIFIEEDLLEEGFQKVPVMFHPKISDFEFQLILLEGWAKQECCDISDTLDNNKIEFNYLEENESAESYGKSIAVLYSLTENLKIEINEDNNEEVCINGDNVEISEVFGCFDEDDTWVLIASI